MKVKIPFQSQITSVVVATITPVAKVYTEHKAYRRSKSELKAEMIKVGLDLLAQDQAEEAQRLLGEFNAAEAARQEVSMDPTWAEEQVARISELEQKLMNMAGASLPEMIAGLNNNNNNNNPSIHEFLDANFNKEGSAS
jgi:TolA-binding protein